MHPLLRLSVPFVLLSFFAAASSPRVAEEPAEDLQPLDPGSRAIFAGTPGFPMHGSISGQVLSADGKTLLMSGHMGLSVWDVIGSKSGQPRTLQADNFYIHGAVAALSSDGKTAAAIAMLGGNQDMPIRFFDTATGKETRQIENDQHINGLAFSPDGRFLAVATQARIEMWDAAKATRCALSRPSRAPFIDRSPSVPTARCWRPSPSLTASRSRPTRPR
jgi:WD40 repeat protein